MSHEEIARVAHEVNRAFCEASGDWSHVPWEAAPEWQRSAAVDGVGKALAGATPEALHESWCRFKVADGWTFGPVKDPGAKTHPCLVPYGDLPPHQRVKDHLFSAVVAALQ